MQNKLDARDARKYVNTDNERSSNDETLNDNDSLSDGRDDGSDDKFILPYKGEKGGINKKGYRSYRRSDDRNEKGNCHKNSETPRRSMRKKGGEKGGRIRKYVRCDIVDDEFESQAVTFIKDCR